MRVSEWMLGLLVTAIWGLNYSFIKLGLQSMDPYLLAALRFALCALPAVLLVPRPAIGWSAIAAYGLLFGVLQWGLVYTGIHWGVAPGLASLLLQASVFFTMGLGVLVFGERIGVAQIAGAALGLAGIALIFAHAGGQANLAGLALVLLGALAWALSNVVVKQSGCQQMFGLVVWSSLVSPLPLLAMSYASVGAAGIAGALAALDARAMAAIAFQVYPTTLFGYAIWNRLLRRHPVSRVAPLALLVPVFGMAGAVLVLGESLPAYKPAAMALILAGLLVQRYGAHFITVTSWRRPPRKV